MKLEKVHGVPWWMNTRPGRWLCVHWHPAATLWQALMDKNKYDKADWELEWSKRDLERAAVRCVDSGFSEESRRMLADAASHARTAGDDLHRAAVRLSRHILSRDKMKEPWL